MAWRSEAGRGKARFLIWEGILFTVKYAPNLYVTFSSEELRRLNEIKNGTAKIEHRVYGTKQDYLDSVSIAKHKEIIMRLYRCNMEQREIADLLGVSAPAVCKWIKRWKGVDERDN